MNTPRQFPSDERSLILSECCLLSGADPSLWTVWARCDPNLGDCFSRMHLPAGHHLRLMDWVAYRPNPNSNAVQARAAG